MANKFNIAAENKSGPMEFGSLRWLSRPSSTGAKQLTAMDVTIKPGKGHSFHRHPDQEEVIFIVAGNVEQWIEREKRILGPGDSAFIPAGLVHASFTHGQVDARMVVTFGPCVGEGFETVEVAGEAPWKGLRT